MSAARREVTGRSLTAVLALRPCAAVYMGALACTPAPKERPNGAPQPSHGAVSSAGSAAARPAIPRTLGGTTWTRDGCDNGIEFDGLTVERALEALAARCAPGMSPLLPAPHVTERATAGVTRQSFDIADPTRCVRIIGIATGGTDVDLRLLRGGSELSRDATLAPYALLNDDGPWCASTAGTYVAELTTSAPSLALIQIYAAD